MFLYKNKVKSFFSFCLVLGILSSLNLVVIAQDDNEGYNNQASSEMQKEAEKQALKNKTSDQAIENCEILVDRLDDVHVFYESNINLVKTNYQTILQKSKILLPELSNQTDSNKAKDVVNQLDESLTSFNEESTKLLEQVKTTQASSCSKPKTEFLSNLKIARESVQKLNETNKKMTEQAKSIKNEIQALNK